jgi:GTP-binding protein
MAKRRKLPLFEISPVTGEGIDKLKYAIADAVQLHRGLAVDAPAPKTAPKKRKPRFPPPASSSHGSRSR